MGAGGARRSGGRMTDNGDSPKVLGEIRIAVAERAGQVELQFSMTGVCGDNEIQARGLWDKAHEAMARFFLEKQLAQARQAMAFSSTQAQALMYAASKLTDRSGNFVSMADSPEAHRAATERVRSLEIPPK